MESNFSFESTLMSCELFPSLDICHFQNKYFVAFILTHCLYLFCHKFKAGAQLVRVQRVQSTCLPNELDDPKNLFFGEKSTRKVKGKEGESYKGVFGPIWKRMGSFSG